MNINIFLAFCLYGILGIHFTFSIYPFRNENSKRLTKLIAQPRSEYLHKSYSKYGLGDHSGVMSWTRHVQGMRQVRNAYKSLAGNSEGMRVFMGPRRRGENDIRVHLWGVRVLNVLNWLRVKFSGRLL